MYLNTKYIRFFSKVFKYKIQNSILSFKYVFEIHVFEILPIPVYWLVYTGHQYGSICVAKFNLKCNMQNGNAICKMAMYFCI